ncbi:MAG: hypothetical protein HXX18_12275 [Bacteroidetes bacterium]|nr:hypothetical protein [Bacteroidota bacterium]
MQSIKRIACKNNIYVEATDYAINYLSELGFDSQYGARQKKRVIQSKILNELSKMILSGKFSADKDIIIDTFAFRNNI